MPRGPVILWNDPPRGDLCAGGNGAVGAGPVGASAGPASHIPDPLGQRHDHARIAAHHDDLDPPGLGVERGVVVEPQPGGDGEQFLCDLVGRHATGGPRP